MITSSERLAARMKGEPVDRIPNMALVMQFAADQINAPLALYYQDYHVLCEANFKTVERFHLDLVDAISDPYREAADFGAKIKFPDNDLPLCQDYVLDDISNLANLPAPDPLAADSRNACSPGGS